MKNFKRILALVLAVMMVVAGMVSTTAADAKVEYNETAIARLKQLDIFKGRTSGDAADSNVTREEMALFASRVMTGEVDKAYWTAYTNDTTFEDIDGEDAEFVGAIAYAFEEGLVIGKDEAGKRFDPKGNVTYQDALVMVVRSLGYTGLNYPNGYINKAMKLGLTADINAAYNEPALRGVVATILYNALYAEDSLFAENFDLTTDTYMLVASPAKTTAKGNLLAPATIGGYVGKEINADYVAFAPIDEYNKPVNSGYVYVPVEKLADDFAGVEFANRLGYAYELTFEGKDVAWVDECANKTFKNFADKLAITATTIKYRDGKNAPQTGKFLTFGGEEYVLVDRDDPDYSLPTGTKALVLYTVGAADVYLNEYDYLYDANGNVVAADGTVLLYLVNGVYYVDNNGIRREATDADWNNALSVVATQTVSGYSVFEQSDDVVKSLADNYFCELTALDYDNDGEYDAAIYTPYFIGHSAGDQWKALNITAPDGAAKVTGDPKDWTVTGAVTSISNWTVYLYKINRLINEVNIIQKLDWVDSKVVSAAKGQAVLADGNFTYPNSWVQFASGETKYKIGGWTEANLNGLTNLSNLDGGAAVTAQIMNGWSDIFVEAMDAKYTRFDKLIILAGRVIYTDGELKTAAATYNYDFVAFDPFTSVFTIKNDQLVVSALTDATGVYKEVVIDSINGEPFAMIELDAFLKAVFGLYGDQIAASKISYYWTNAKMKAAIMATPLYKMALRYEVIDTLYTYAADVHKDSFNVASDLYNETLVYSINAKNADGSLDINPDVMPAMYATPNKTTITFKFGVSSVAIHSGKTPIATTKDTVFTFVAADGIYTYVGQPADTYSLVLTDTTSLYKCGADQIMIIDQTRAVEEIAVGPESWTGVAYNALGERIARAHDLTWKFTGSEVFIPYNFQYDETYLITSKTTNTLITRDEDNNPVYTYENLYDLEACKYVTVVFTVDAYNDFTAALEAATGSNKVTENVGAVVCRNLDIDGSVAETVAFAYADYSNGQDVVFKTPDDFTAGVLESFNKDNASEYAHFVIDGVDYTVRGVNFVVITNTKDANGNVICNATDVSDVSAIKVDAQLYFNYNVATGELTGYAFNK